MVVNRVFKKNKYYYSQLYDIGKIRLLLANIG